MFDIAVLEDLLVIQDWGKFERISDDVSLQQERINAVIKAVASEIKSDFSL
jgi:hypothetical protein